MAEIRFNPITGDWVIIAVERARRPEAFVTVRPDRTLPPRSPACPFCPGNEAQAPGETYRIAGADGWQVRVVPNKFPALAPTGGLDHRVEGFRNRLAGVGFHEVIVETPRHDLTPALLPRDHVRLILQAGRDRYRAIYADPRVQQVILFKNHGERAGTSLEHPHAQIVGSPVVSAQIRFRSQRALEHMDETSECLYCQVLADEVDDGRRLVAANRGFVAFVPYAALSPFHLWIFPRQHRSSFATLDDTGLDLFAEILHLTLGKLYVALNNPDYNYVVRSVPGADPKREYFHWYLTIVPRVTQVAGFEMGSGMFVNTALPEDSARLLRDTPPPAA